MSKKNKKAETAQEQLTKSASAALRAIGKHAVPVSFDKPPAQEAKSGEPSAVHIPWKLDPTNPAESIVLLRGAIDKAAFEKRYNDPKLAQNLRPADRQAALIYDALEQARYESCGTDDFPGGGRNVQNAILNEAAHRPYSPDIGENLDDLAAAFYFAARKAMTGFEPPAHYTQAVKAVEDAIGTLEDKNTLDKLPSVMRSQNDYAHQIRALLQKFLELADIDPSGSDDDPGAEDGAEKKKSDDQGDGDGDGEDNDSDDDDMEAQQKAMRAARDKAVARREGTDDDQDESESAPDTAGSRTEIEPDDDKTRYRVYTRAFDEVLSARTLQTDTRTINDLRKTVNRYMQDMKKSTGRLAARLRRRLMAQEQSPVRFDQDLEDGLLDTTRLTRAITDPFNATIWKRERETEDNSTVVTLLVDNSGSMRGQPILMALLSTYMLADTLERCGVKVEILGFTTKQWKGGESRSKWMADGRPDNPGRINDLLHIVYKTADEKMRHSRDSLLSMLLEGTLKENIDGEALQWAHGRLLQRPEKRKILIVLSDGAPCDDSTAGANGTALLSNHLRQVIGDIQNDRRVELSAIGIGHDVRKYYKNGIQIQNAEDLGTTMLAEAERLFIRDERLRSRFRKPGGADLRR